MSGSFFGMRAAQIDATYVVGHLMQKGETSRCLHDLDRIGTLHQAWHAVRQALRRSVRFRCAAILGADTSFQDTHVFRLQRRRDPRLRSQHVLVPLQPPHPFEVVRVGVWRRGAIRRGSCATQRRRQGECGITAVVQRPLGRSRASGGNDRDQSGTKHNATCEPFPVFECFQCRHRFPLRRILLMNRRKLARCEPCDEICA